MNEESRNAIKAWINAQKESGCFPASNLKALEDELENIYEQERRINEKKDAAQNNFDEIIKRPDVSDEQRNALSAALRDAATSMECDKAIDELVQLFQKTGGDQSSGKV